MKGCFFDMWTKRIFAFTTVFVILSGLLVVGAWGAKNVTISELSNMPLNSFKPIFLDYKLTDKGNDIFDLEFFIEDPNLKTATNISAGIVDFYDGDFRSSGYSTYTIDPVPSNSGKITINLKNLTYTKSGNSIKFRFAYNYENAPNNEVKAAYLVEAEISELAKTPTSTGMTPFVRDYSISSTPVTKDNSYNFAFNVIDPNFDYRSNIQNVYAVFESGDFVIPRGVTQAYDISPVAKGYSISFLNVIYTGKGKTVKFRFGYSYKDHPTDTTYKTADYTITVTIAEAVEYEKPEAPTPPTPEEKPDPLSAHLILSSFSTGEGQLMAGEEFPFSFAFKNMSTEYSIQNMVIKVSGGEKLGLSKGTNTMYIASMAPGAVATRSVSLITAKNLVPGAYPVTIKVDYEYYANKTKKTGSADLSASINIGQVDRVKIGTVKTTEGFVGDEVELIYSVINSGFTKLYNCEITVLDESGNELLFNYLGAIESQKEFKDDNSLVKLNTPGTSKYTLVFSYEDENMEQKSITREFDVVAEEMQEPFYPPFEEFPIEPIPEETGGLPVIWIIAGAGVIVVGGGITAFVLIKRRKAKKDAMLLDEDI